MTQVYRMRARQRLAARKVIVEQKPGPDHPRQAQRRHVRHDELHGMNDVRRASEQHLALGERFGDQAKFVVLEIAQAAVDELAAR